MAAVSTASADVADRGSEAFRSVGVIGGGLMGTGITEVIASAGIPVALVEVSPELAAGAAERIRQSLNRQVEKGRLTELVRDGILDRLVVGTDLELVENCELVVEAVSENLEVKRAVFAGLGRTVGQDAVLASNTSSIPISQLAAEVPAPERVLGIHFFAPVPRMKLVEVVKTLRTDPVVCERVFAFVEHLGKDHIESKDRSGFVVNFLLIPYLLSSIRLMEAGFATREAIDTGMRLGCGYPMGPLELTDLIGLDVVLAVADSLHEEFGEPEYSAPPLLRRMAALGLLGRKSGEGFYDYSDDAPAKKLVRSGA
jgi:3-hydroxybutyryl-CoA dehydrogenase